MESLRVIEAFRNTFYSPLYVIQALGLFEAHGLEVSVQTRDAAEGVLSVLRRDGADVALTGPMRGLVGADAGETELPISFIEVNSRDGFILVSRERFDPFELKDLEGRTVLTYSEPPTPWMCLLTVMKEHGVAADRVQLSTDRSLPEAMTAFQQGEGDFIQLPEPQAEEFIVAGQAHLAVPMGRFSGEIPYTAFAALPAVLERRRDTLLSFTRAVYAGQRWMAGHNPADIAKLTARHLPGVPLEILTAGTERYQSQGTWAVDPLLRREGFDRLRDILRDGGLLKGAHRYEDHVATDLAAAVMAEGLSG